jgi:hypothetical protein
MNNANVFGTAMLSDLQNPELFIGFVCPIGVDLAKAMSITEDILGEFDYKCRRIKLSQTITEIERYQEACTGELSEEGRLRRFPRIGAPKISRAL